ncbi:MAG TPA: 2-oxoglutarate dehydrogenase complex dihydrolipoyllysine-residue succinyltransferase [Bdellovibrionales bacterium]|nr:2-oxoglutarate dehydrogenase complex dihydrolipoyllysine-residue succinyltransferase [Bdellovibrionales bacterium]
MKAEIKVPAVGESISEATIGEWAKKSGEFVKRDEIILLLETDKASVEVVAPNDGVLVTMAKPGEVVKIGATVATIDTEGVSTAGMNQPLKNTEQPPPAPAAMKPSAPPPSTASKVAPELQQHMSPATQRVVNERGLDPAQIKGTGKDGRITKNDAVTAPANQGGLGATSSGYAAPAPAPAAKKEAPPPLPIAKRAGERGERRVPMTTIRKRIAERLVQSQQTTATLTTFNEVDMTQVMALREKYKDKFKERYGLSLGFMGFFVKACTEALKQVPEVNAFIEGTETVYHDYANVGVAVGTEKGLIVPVVKDADQLTIAEIEQSIRHYALKARDGKIAIDDLSGGTFTISNGGVYGSLMSTPILNPPQSAILGMHKIEERPIVVNGKIEIRPMMYLALSYDHRIIDGKEAVTFLVKVKEGIEDPSRLLLEI